jgi:hypothetical protein
MRERNMLPVLYLYMYKAVSIRRLQPAYLVIYLIEFINRHARPNPPFFRPSRATHS